MTVIELKNWLRNKQDNRKIILFPTFPEARELQYTDLGLSVPKTDSGTEPELFD